MSDKETVGVVKPAPGTGPLNPAGPPVNLFSNELELNRLREAIRQIVHMIDEGESIAAGRSFATEVIEWPV